MSQIREIRKKLNLTQAELALFLSIPRSTLSLAELGLRPLKMNDRHCLAELEMAMSGPDQPGNDPTPIRSGSPEMARAKASISRLDIDLSERKLRQMLSKFAELSESLQRVQKILGDPNSDKTKTWYWQGQADKLSSRLEKYGPLKQVAVQEKIKALQAKAAIYEKP